MNARRACVLVCFLLFIPQLASAQRDQWVATWAASPQPSGPDTKDPVLNIDNQTVRERVRVSIGGAQIRLRLSNEYGSTPLQVGAVTVAVPTDASSVQPGSIRKVTFSGHNSVAIPAGAPALSDPVAFPIASGAEVSVSVYFPEPVANPTVHWLALKHAVVSPLGDRTGAEKIDGGATISSSILVSAVLVRAQAHQRLIVTFGDSITDGDGSTPDMDASWPSNLARRLAKTAQGSHVAVVNEGIAGTRLLRDCFMPSIGCFGVSALARFDRDALGVPGRHSHCAAARCQ
jgi:GDSL-like lipase/acylhydrolase family protein